VQIERGVDPCTADRFADVSNHQPDLHEVVAGRIAGELAARSDVLAVMIAGSVARGEHVASSDVDLLVVTSSDAELATSERALVDGLLVEWIARPEAAWLSRFDRPKTSWLYAFLGARIVADTGPAARLQAAARELLASYRTSPALRELLATWLWHGQAKLDRARAADDATARGYWSALFVETVMDGLFAVYDVPLPAGARRLEYLHLVPLTSTERHLLDSLLVGDTERRFDAVCALVADLRGRLGPPDHGM
jgi:predicted nucleotidyltransferase